MWPVRFRWIGSGIRLACCRDASPKCVPFAGDLHLPMVDDRICGDVAGSKAAFTGGQQTHLLSCTLAQGLLYMLDLGDPAVVDGHQFVTGVNEVSQRRALQVRGHHHFPSPVLEANA